MSTFDRETIVALASGSLPSGIACIRATGSSCQAIVNAMFDGSLPARVAVLRKIRNPLNSDVLDEGIALFFPHPASYTGDDVLEFHAHGGRAVVSSILEAMCSIDGVRLAEAGEFSRRAFENGRFDLTALEGIADLISSETEAQRKLALSQSLGSLRDLYEEWRMRLVRIRALVEAEFDFSDEEDVPEEISEEGFRALSVLIKDIEDHINDGRAGEIIRDGYKISLLGEPNIGKSSLLNALVKRDVAIVTDEAGTTRDVLEVHLDVAGYEVIVSDTAGIRDAESLAEQEGIRRAKAQADESDLVIALVDSAGNAGSIYSGSTPVLELLAKDDEGEFSQGSVSSITGHGLDWLISEISDRVASSTNTSIDGLITRKRYRDGLVEALRYLTSASSMVTDAAELRAEELRMASDCIGRITGKIDVEDLLDVIFSEFCVGK